MSPHREHRFLSPVWSAIVSPKEAGWWRLPLSFLARTIRLAVSVARRSKKRRTFFVFLRWPRLGFFKSFRIKRLQLLGGPDFFASLRADGNSHRVERDSMKGKKKQKESGIPLEHGEAPDIIAGVSKPNRS
jgi:hypothetical protein